MKKFFDKENFVFSRLDKKVKNQSLLVSCLVLVCFILSAFTFMNMLYAFSECIGSIVCASVDVALHDLIRALPLFFSFFMSMWSLLLAHALYRNVNEERYRKSLLKNGIAIIAFAVINILFVIVGRIAGVYLSFVEGNPSPIYPLDSILYSALFILVGLSAIFYKSNLGKKFEIVLPSRGPIAKKVRFVYCFFVSIWSLIALFSFADFFIGLFIIDFFHGYFFYSLMFLIVLLVNAFFIGVWEFYYNELEEEKKKEFLLPLGLAGLCLSGLVTILYFVALGLNLDAPSNIGFGVFPVAFAASVNMATLLVVFTPVIVSVTAVIKGLLSRKACNKQ